MYFTLGLLTAGLLSLMIMPAIWRRASRLTLRRFEAATPISFSEIRAEKDQIRAEFAMATRRLEMSVEELREKGARQLVEINRNQQTIQSLRTECGDRAAIAAELREQERLLRAELLEKEESLAEKSAGLRQARRELRDRQHNVEKLERAVERAARQAKTVAAPSNDNADQDVLETEIAELKTAKSAAELKLAKAQGDLEEAQIDYQEERERAAGLETKVARLQKLVDRQSEELKSKTTALSEAFTGADPEKSAETIATLESDLMEARAEIAKLTLKVDDAHTKSSTQSDESSSELRMRLASLETELSAIKLERDSLRIERDQISASAEDDWQDERAESAILRERINDVASQVATITASVEKAKDEGADADPESGTESDADMSGGKVIKAVNKSAKAQKTWAKPDKPKSQISKKVKDVANGNEQPETISTTTLADRIRALQDNVARSS